MDEEKKEAEAAVAKKEDSVRHDETKEERRPPWKLMILFLVVILSLLIKVPYVHQESYTVSLPVNVTMAVIEKRQFSVEDCYLRNYSWDYRWDGWDPEINNRISPRFFLTNTENKSGFYEVQFAFLDDSIYRYEDYANKEVTNVPWAASAMTSERIRMLFAPNETKLILIPTQKKEPDKTYWTYADVLPSSYDFCVDRLESRDESVVRNFTKYVQHEATNCSIIWDFWWKNLVPQI